MKELHLYPTRKLPGKDFSKEKLQVVPNQSLTLKDIIQRFIRKESLPIGREGIYNEQLGDLEKIAREDIVDQQDRANRLRTKLDNARRKQEVEKSTPPTPAPTNPAASPAAPTPQTTPPVPGPQGT